MKIIVEPGRPVDLDARRRTSVHGGTYDVSDLTPEQQKRLLAQPGVREEKPAKAEKTKEA